MGNCVTTLQLAGSGTSPQETAHQLIRSGDGKIRVDTGNVSVITDPATKKTILLDHLNKEARALAMPSGQLPQMQIPGMPQVAAPTLPTVAPPAVQANIQDLGKQLIGGEEAVGKRITIQPPPMPAMPNMPGVPGMPGVPQIPSPPGVPGMPGMPGMPGVPQMPGMPGVPGMPAIPPQPQPPNVTEIWTNPNLHLPVLTQVNGAFGQQTCRCKNQAIPEPDPSTFEIPKDYKDLTQG